MSGAAPDPWMDRLLACVHCGFCLPACPTYRALGDEADSPRGRLHLMRALEEGRIADDDPSLHLHLDRCLGCRACEPVCPSGVVYGELLEHTRARLVRARPPGVATRLLLAVFGTRWSNALAGWGGRLLRRTGLPALLARRLPPEGPTHGVRLGLAMLAASAPWRGLEGGRTGSVEGGRGPEPVPHPPPDPHPSPVAAGAPVAVDTPALPLRVGVLAGCVQQGLFRRVGAATRRTLAANGYQVVEVPDPGCCGALHAHAGALEGARDRARRVIRAFQDAGVDRVAVDAAGCGAAMKGYGVLLEDDPVWRDRATAFSATVRDVSELLAQAGPRSGAAIPLEVAYDPPCHLLHGQGVSQAVAQVLGAIPGLRVVTVPDGDRCCGGAGIYGLTHRELGGAVAGEKVRAVTAAGCPVVLTGNPGCMMQIGAGLLLAGEETGVVHPVELLDESYRRAGIHGGDTGGNGDGGSGRPRG